jgi:uncharacterized protein YbjT (DUF2867 family)
MKILGTGGTGNVGAEVVKELLKRKADIRLLVRKGQAGISAVDIRDIAEAAAIALTSDGHLGKPTT